MLYAASHDAKRTTQAEKVEKMSGYGAPRNLMGRSDFSSSFSDWEKRKGCSDSGWQHRIEGRQILRPRPLIGGGPRSGAEGLRD